MFQYTGNVRAEQRVQNVAAPCMENKELGVQTFLRGGGQFPDPLDPRQLEKPEPVKGMRGRILPGGIVQPAG